MTLWRSWRLLGLTLSMAPRPLKRAIQSRIENPLAQDLLAGKFSPGDVIRVSASDGKACV